MADDRRARDEEFEREALVQLDVLYSVALRLTGEPADAQDLVQETMLRAYRSWDRYEPGTNCRAWLITILRNLFINRFRHEERRPHRVQFEAVEGFSAFDEGGLDVYDPEGSFFHRIVDDEVLRAIRDLPEEFRTPIVLSDVEGLSYVEIAGILGVPMGTVKSRLFRGRRRLQERLGEYALEMGFIR